VIVLVLALSLMAGGVLAQGQGHGALPGQVDRPFIIDRDGFVELSWSDPDDGASNITGYILYRGLAEDDIKPVYVVDPSSTGIHDIYVENGVTYYYAVQALNAMGVGPISPVVNATPYAAPLAPNDMVVKQKDGKVTISWAAPNASAARAEVTGYFVYRGTDPDLMDPIAELGPDEFSYVDEDVKEDKTYYYAVGANSAIGHGNLTEQAKLTVEGPEGTVFAVIVVSVVGILLMLVCLVAWRLHGADVGKEKG
jgi:hypothetical protein